jgi:hypothetical protein
LSPNSRAPGGTTTEALPRVAATRDHGNNRNVPGVLLEQLPIVSSDAAPLHISDDNCREKDLYI